MPLIYFWFTKKKFQIITRSFEIIKYKIDLFIFLPFIYLHGNDMHDFHIKYTLRTHTQYLFDHFRKFWQKKKIRTHYNKSVHFSKLPRRIETIPRNSNEKHRIFQSQMRGSRTRIWNCWCNSADFHLDVNASRNMHWRMRGVLNRAFAGFSSFENELVSGKVTVLRNHADFEVWISGFLSIGFFF